MITRLNPFLLPLLVFILHAAEVSAQKTDILVLRNGDRITGEVSGLTRGILRYKTDDAGTLQVEWDKVASLHSLLSFEVELTTQRKLFGSILEGPQPGTARIGGETLALISIVSITEISPSILERTSGYLDLGWTLAKANHAHTANFGAEARYRGERLGSKLGFSFYEQGQSGAELTRSANLNLDINRFFGPVWAARVFAELSRDNALQLDLRSYVGTAARRSIVRTNRMDATVSAGLVGTRESFAGEPEGTYSLEVNAAADFAVFRLDSPELDLTMELKTFTSLTESERIRADLNSRVRYEVFNDFFLALTLKSSVDSNPPSVNASKSSYTLGLSVGWSW